MRVALQRRYSKDSNSVVLEKKPVMEFIISDVAGLQPALFLKLNSFSVIFTDFTTDSESYFVVLSGYFCWYIFRRVLEFHIHER